MRLGDLIAGMIVVLIGAVPLGAQQKQKPKWAPNPNVAATDPLRPEEQIKKMKVPPGFEIQLVAADPDIRKPINIAFDAAGRLWVTETIEYPFAAPPGKGRDAVKILEDFGPDGRARKITTFAGKLNIPIGVMPDTDGKGALVYSIPAISHLRDTTGKGKADQCEIYYSGFGHDDTHGMTGEFQWGFDGWIYACHGFRNHSVVKSRDGKTSIDMTSGNTYRIKPDGSRIEKFTTGQVNPFGMAIDPFGNIYTGDCHSLPLTMLLRGAWYQSFSRPHDGLGFAPHMNTFKNHSTALCGVSYYAADQFPKEYHGKLFLGDVVLNRLNAYKLEWTGASPRAIMEDFVTCSDPWFRPVDIKLGPDGCLYFADFYNRIIGHYEVDLKHPGRDRDKGRIWRIVYRGKPGEPPGSAGGGRPQPVTNLARADVKTLVHSLASPNITVRLLAANQLVERGGREAVEMLRPFAKGIGKKGQADAKAHALWILERLGQLDEITLLSALSAQEKEVRVHAQRILTEKKTWSIKYLAMAKIGLLDEDALVQRAAVEAMAAHPEILQIPALLSLRHKIPAGDQHLIYAVRLALRNQLRDESIWRRFTPGAFSDQDHRALADVCLGVHNQPSASFLQSYLKRFDESPERTRAFVHYIVREGGPGTVPWAIQFAVKKFGDSTAAQGVLLKTILQANQERGVQLAEADRKELEAVVFRFLAAENSGTWAVGAELAGAIRLAKVQPDLLALVRSAIVPATLRKTCVNSLIQIDAQKAIPALEPLLLNEGEAITIREQVANALAATNNPAAHNALVKALEKSPARLQTTIALGMAGSPQGGARLLQAIEAGKASRHLLQIRTIEVRLASAKIGNVKNRLKKLTQGLPPADQKTQQLIAVKRDAFASFKADVNLGQKVFQKHCAACHQVAGQGAKIGPQLDGIGIRGLERILEDIVDPSRNVDQAFRTTVITTKNGQTKSGLFLREEGNIVILADPLGKDLRIDKKEIDERALSPLSPMPSNFAEQIGEADFHHLMAYLLRQRGKQ